MDKQLTKLKMLSKMDVAAVVLIAAAFIYLFVTSFFDGTISDEAFYISIPYRLMNGDGLFTDEWHLSQLSAVLLYLPVKLYTGITGGTAGIILYMRMLFCIMQLTVGAFAYKTLQKEGLSAVIISLSFMLYSVIGLNTLSYNTMGASLLLVMICVSYSLCEKPSLLKMFFLGSLTAMFILCQPVGVFLYLIYFTAVLCIMIICRAKNKNIPFPFRPVSFMMTVIGILPILAFFLYLLLKNSDIETIIKCVPGILSDVEHMEITETLGIETFSVVQFFIDMTMAAGAIPLIITAALIIVSVIIKKKNKTLAIIITSSALIVFTLVFWFRLFFMNNTTETDDINFFFFPLALSGIAFYLLSEKKNNRVFILFWCTGILYALFMTISSNLRLHASVNGYIIAAAGSLILTKNLLGEIKTKNTGAKLQKISAAVLITAVFGFSVFHTGTAVLNFVISRASFQSAKMTQGIYSGITLPSDQALTYTDIYNDAIKIKELIKPDDKIFIIENIPALYLDGEFNMGVHSGWFIAEQLAVPEIRDRFRNYYEINPENLPEFVYVPAYTYTETGLAPVNPKKLSDFEYALFEGEAEDIGSGLLITVKGIKDE